ncbi:F-box domain-containing protein [Aphelenchoides bicaudatus]|nr:F-box domain-containing protein [Aphelenchoides bicaudatus]
MPFYGQDWRSPGETWIRLGDTANWERAKLRPIQIASTSDSTLGLIINEEQFKRHSSSASFSSSTDDNIISQLGTSPSSISIPRSESEESSNEEEDWKPHCFVKSKSKEFIGCTSMSEAFHRLDLARAVVDVQRFNYVCKVVQILVVDKLPSLSASARKHLLAIIQSIVINSVENDVHVSTARDLVTQFGSGLEGHVYGSPKLVPKQMDVVSTLVDSLVGIIADHGTKMLPDSSEESITFLDLPKEILSEILRRVQDHVSILEAAKAHEVINALVTQESRLWKSLANFHFTQEQITKHNKPEFTWRHLFFELKKFYGLRETYADMINICCHCKALFWKNIGHPCVSDDAPSVRVTPLQFVQMLNEL